VVLATPEKRFFVGKKAKDLEDTLEKLEEDIAKLKGLLPEIFT
jgi:hypothetical protein